MARGLQFSQGELAKICSSHFPGLRCVGRLCSVQLSITHFSPAVHPKMRCWCWVPSSGTSPCACCSWSLVRTSPSRPIWFPLFQIYLPIAAYSCLHYKYFCKAPLKTPQLCLLHCTCQLVLIYRYCDSICGSRCGTGSSRARCWEKVERKYHVQLFANIIFPNFGK